MKPDSQFELVNRFFSGTGTTYDRIVNVCTVGLDRWWKKRIIECIPDEPVRVVDQASGTGILSFQIARRFPGCQVIGVELRKEYIDIAQGKKNRLGVGNVDFVQGRAEDVFLRGGVDCITSSYLAKYAEPERLVVNAGRMLRDGGVLIAHDFTYPAVRVFARVWEAYFRLLQGIGTRRFPQWREAFFGLPALLRETTWVSDLPRALHENRFRDVRVRTLFFGAAALVTARRA